MNKNVICFLGPPGSGKGTYSLKCFNLYKNKFALHRFSVGDEIRTLGVMSSQGNLADIELVNKVINHNFSKPYNSIIIDGYPRSVDQMFFLLNKVKNKMINNLVIFNLEVKNKDILIERLSHRNNCAKCGYTCTESRQTCPVCNVDLSKRNDDLAIETINKRINIYYNFYEKIEELAKENNIKIHQFDSSSDMESTFDRIRKHFEKSL